MSNKVYPDWGQQLTPRYNRKKVGNNYYLPGKNYKLSELDDEQDKDKIFYKTRSLSRNSSFPTPSNTETICDVSGKDKSNVPESLMRKQGTTVFMRYAQIWMTA